MRVLLKYGGVIILGMSFWAMYDMGGKEQHTAGMLFDRYTAFGLGAWLSALWAGGLLNWNIKD